MPKSRVPSAEEKAKSALPLGGPLAPIRRLGHGVARAWDLRWALKRQADFNLRIVAQLDALAAELAELKERARSLESQAIEADRAIVEARTERAESRIALRRDLEALVRRLDHLEALATDGDRADEPRARSGHPNGRDP